MLKIVFAISLFLVISGCTTKPTATGAGAGVAIWNIDSKAQITDKRRDSSNNVDIDIFFMPGHMIRLEVTAILGYRVGSLFMSPQQIQYALHPNKVFVRGPFHGRTLKPLFKQEIDPRLLWAVIHDQSLDKYGFTCAVKTVTIQNCQSSQATVEIEKREEDQKKITIENANLKMVWIFKSKEVSDKSQNETFVLNPPEGYRLIDIK